MSVYNADKYLPIAIDSIINQTYTDFEFLIIDDCSTDNSSNIIKDYLQKDDRIKFFPNQVNLGLTKNLNKLILLAKGEYIARMDADDISHKLRFEKQTYFLDNNPEISVVGGSIQEFDEKSTNLGIRRYPRNTEEVLKCIAKASPFAHPTVMFRKNVFDNGLTYSERFTTSQDIDLWFKLLKNNYMVANIDVVVLYYRVSKEFYARRSKTKAINEFKIYWNGIISLQGITWKLIYPIMRLGFRLAPKFLVKKIYSGKIRKSLILDDHNK